MPKIVFTPEELTLYFSPDFKSEIQEKAREFEHDIRVHSDGIFPEEIIDKARPNESEAVKEYRKLIWQPKTKPTFSKVFSSLSKIRRSSDWVIGWPNEASTKIPEGETLEDYTTLNYPKFTTLENWIFQVLLREYLIDANAVCVVFPGETPSNPAEFKKPIAQIFNSEEVIDFKAEDYVILKNPNGAVYVENGREVDGDSYFIITTEQYLQYDQINVQRDFALVVENTHELGYIPAWKLGGVLMKTEDSNLLYESRIAGMLPELNEAVREYSDLQAAVIMNIFPERWEVGFDCPECNGTGKVTNVDAVKGFEVCKACDGSGHSPVSPFRKLLVRPVELGQQPITPPAGYIDKDSAIVELQDRRVNKHIFDALAAVNMEFLAEAPLSESGIAKEVDRDETNNTVHAVAEDIVANMDLIMYFIAKIRYGLQHREEELEELLPPIAVPEHFDIFSVKYDEEELKNAKLNKINPVLINAMEIAYATKKFNSEPDVMRKLVSVLTLDPLSNITEEDKALRLSNKGITLDDYILSSNIVQFVERAVNEDDNFLTLDPIKQREVLLKYVEEVKDKSSMESEIKNELFPEDAETEEPLEEEETLVE